MLVAGQLTQTVQQFIGGMYRPVIAQRNPRLRITAQVIDAHPALAGAKGLQDIESRND